MRTVYFYLMLMLGLLSSCASTKSVNTDQIKNIVEKQYFNIESDIAQPSASVGMANLQNSGLLGIGNSASNINLIGNSNFLEVKGDSITSYLPYYGERYSNVGYGSDNGGIELEGDVKNYVVVWNDKKQHYTITFQAKSKNSNELFDARLVLYPNLKSYLTLSSPSRTSITYIGKVKEIYDKTSS
ncbi:DUF4251 domain-containing protein [Aureibaculum marinum]|uniref:DUF4251 domain-containing protein n=1 Tax=Aureibaculum marinum TaxID=2487930 RepID=A0A3N4P083_9FLAO|nr:DUF4251 domain-containing protein [Aureibaculum marinum]RPD97950.1 DUF4251 domain-containing protein [Aureibaculum marinum]